MIQYIDYNLFSGKAIELLYVPFPDCETVEYLNSIDNPDEILQLCPEYQTMNRKFSRLFKWEQLKVIISNNVSVYDVHSLITVYARGRSYRGTGSVSLILGDNILHYNKNEHTWSLTDGTIWFTKRHYLSQRYSNVHINYCFSGLLTREEWFNRIIKPELELDKFIAHKLNGRHTQKEEKAFTSKKDIYVMNLSVDEPVVPRTHAVLGNVIDSVYLSDDDYCSLVVSDGNSNIVMSQDIHISQVSINEDYCRVDLNRLYSDSVNSHNGQGTELRISEDGVSILEF